MIVNYTEGGWEVIAQRAHGLLAAQLALQWKHDVRNERWPELLLVIAEHDDAQVELERDNLLTPQGGPVDFKMKVFEKRHAAQTMDFARSKSRYIALLCSMHLDFVYGKDPAAAGFIKAQRTLQKQWRKELKLTPVETDRGYRLVEWCDALSLLLCQHENQPEERVIEISQGYQLRAMNEQALTVEPWPFQDERFELYVEIRLIPQLTFKNAADFRSAFLKAPVKEKRWTLQKRAA